MTILTYATQVQLWHDAVRHGEEVCSISLKEDLEAYLVFLLIRYMNQPAMVKQIIAEKFLESLQAKDSRREVMLQSVGDECLLFTGFFPRITERRQVKLSYFVELGQSAYGTISHAANDTFSLLANHFVMLMDVLQSIRQSSKDNIDLLPFEAYDQWNTVGSQRALHALKQYSPSIHPMPTKVKDEDSCFIKLGPGKN